MPLNLTSKLSEYISLIFNSQRMDLSLWQSKNPQKCVHLSENILKINSKGILKLFLQRIYKGMHTILPSLLKGANDWYTLNSPFVLLDDL